MATIQLKKPLSSKMSMQPNVFPISFSCTVPRIMSRILSLMRLANTLLCVFDPDRLVCTPPSSSLPVALAFSLAFARPFI
ncbi:hypothetical protein TSMEX_009942 [Taenia solium]|eukprot:TsM_000763300 transcript=TsM_000763300 gene=TsM_000763300